MADERSGSNHGWIDRAAVAILAVSALIIAGVMIKREFWPAMAAPAATIETSPKLLANFDELVSAGIRMGNPASQVTIVEFADFECPFCRRFHAAYSAVQQRFGEQVSLVFLHYPIQSHRFARPAARAAECAMDQGRFSQYADLLFQKQDSLGLKGWTSFADEAGVADTAAFSRCASETHEIERIENGLRLGEVVGVRGTPTVIVNGWMYPEPPSEERLQTIVNDLLAGGIPKN